MTGYSDAYTPSSFTDAIHVASDIKEDQSGFLSGLSIINTIAIVLAIALMVFLIIELAWREGRQRRQEDRTEPTPEADPREGDASP